MKTRESHGFTHLIVEKKGPRSLLLLHGTGGDERDLLNLGGVLDPKAHLVSPRGNVREGEMARFFRRIRPGLFDEEDIRLRVEELGRFVSETAREHTLAPDALWGVGFSNGANMAAALLLLRPDLLAGAVLFRPMLPVEPEESVDLKGVAVYIAAGTRDEMIPAKGTEALIERLGAAGAEVTVTWAQAGHRFSSDEVEAARAWLDEQG